MKVKNKLKNIVKSLEGNIIGIGIEEELLLKTITNNNKIINCDLLNSSSKGDSSKGKSKKIKISKIRKKFKKKKTDYMICNINTINIFIKKIIPDSIYLNKNYIYLYQNNFNDIDRIKTYYGRYTNDIEEIKCEDGIILKINTNSKTNKLKEIIFNIMNFFSDMTNMITEILLK